MSELHLLRHVLFRLPANIETCDKTSNEVSIGSFIPGLELGCPVDKTTEESFMKLFGSHSGASYDCYFNQFVWELTVYQIDMCCI